MPLPRGVDALPSGRYRARFTADGRKYAATWDTLRQATAWMQRTRRDLALGVHDDSPDPEPATGGRSAPLLDDYAAPWIDGRDVKDSTWKHYRALYAQPIGPALGRRRIDAIEPSAVGHWHAAVLPDSPTRRAHAYGLPRTILGTAVAEDLIAATVPRARRWERQAGHQDRPAHRQAGGGSRRRDADPEVPRPHAAVGVDGAPLRRGGGTAQQGRRRRR